MQQMLSKHFVKQLPCAGPGYITNKSKVDSLQAYWEHLLKLQYHHRGDPPQYTVARQTSSAQADLVSDPVTIEKE